MGADRETDNDPERLADELEREAEDMEQRSEGLEDKVIEVRREWDRKRSDPSVPGAVPEDREAPPEKEEGESPAPEAPPENAETKTPPTDSAETTAPPTDSDQPPSTFSFVSRARSLLCGGEEGTAVSERLAALVLPVGDPLAARSPTDRADTGARAIVDAAPVIDDQILLATQ